MLQLHGNTDLLGNLGWLIAVSLSAFLVSWFLTDRLRVHRTLYVGLLAIVAGAMSAAYLTWSGLGIGFWVNNWLWGLVGAVLTSGLLAILISRRMTDAGTHPRPIGVREVVWEAVVYGAAEGLLLSVLPVVIVWQAATGLNAGAIVAGALALIASLAVIVIHHLGYADFRGKKMRLAIAGCLPLSLAYVLTGSPISAMAAHMVLHFVALRRGMELPPDESAQALRSVPGVAAVS
jgi:hypothetical protein